MEYSELLKQQSLVPIGRERRLTSLVVRKNKEEN